MSYIPRQTGGTATAATTAREEHSFHGRADEIRAAPSIRSSNAANSLRSGSGGGNGSRSQTQAQPQQQNGAARLPSSTRASVIKVISDGTALPELPPIPGLDMGTMSFASTSGFSPAASMHRRSASAGDEVKRESRLKSNAREVEVEEERETDVEEARTLDAGSVSRPRAKSRL
ncbi:hypothetical protein GGI05_006589, partial [Coemansia sp. RSA 2603]